MLLVFTNLEPFSRKTFHNLQTFPNETMSAEDAGSVPRGREPIESTEPADSASSSQDPPTLSGSTPRNASLERVAKPVNEQSPLLSAPDSGYGDGEEDGLVDDQTVLNKQDEYQVTKSIWWLILLTISIGGLQIAWAVELSNGSPYLLSLGLSKSLMALVWIAGPLSGSLVQPYVGVRSDNCRISWGKRKPFMISGTAATICSLLILAWVREIVGGFLGLFGAESESYGMKNCIIILAVIMVYILDFSINTGMPHGQSSHSNY
jgi:solute carrier family 45, member 1/2/4